MDTVQVPAGYVEAEQSSSLVLLQGTEKAQLFGLVRPDGEDQDEQPAIFVLTPLPAA